MAVTARLRNLDGVVSLRLYADEPAPELTEDEPEGWDPTAPFYLLWDALKLDHGEWECWGVKAHLDLLTDLNLDALEQLGLPRVDVSELDMLDVTVADVLRRAKDAYQQHRVVA
jgi:hypothetical protein